MIFIIHSSCSFRPMDTSSGFLILPVTLTGRIRCSFTTANRHRRNLICLFIIIQADKCKCNCWTALVPRRSPFWIEMEAEERAAQQCLWHAILACVMIFKKKKKGANFHIKKRRCVLLDVQRALLPVWMELWELLVYAHVFNGSTASKPRRRRRAAVCEFRLKIVVRQWRGEKSLF